MKKKSLRLEKLSLQKSTIVHLGNKAAAIVKGGQSGLLDPRCNQLSYTDGPLSCIGHSCESWITEDPTCRGCAEM
ncbi:class I lanthipeptide [Taibaiella helva]|uniref:class I lanthipeptide n=1 Tax=Taibaiella helva TaxID=2301235 RepID=UPI000E5824FC|nr:class I lanthipeptide [Taibaiella helva]